MRSKRAFMRTASLLAALPVVGFASKAVRANDSSSVRKVVFHVDDESHAREALLNVKHFLLDDPNADIDLVANGRGIFMLVKGSMDFVGEYATEIAHLQGQGVSFKGCRNAIKVFKIPLDSLVSNVEVVPSGVVELARLQIEEHRAYIKP